MNRKFQLLAVLTISGLVLSGDAALGDVSADAAAVLQRYTQSLDWLQSVSMRIDINAVPTGYPDKGPYGVTLLFRRDGNRAEWRGQIFRFDGAGNIDPNTAHTINEIFTPNRYVSFGNPANERLRGAFVSRNFSEDLKRLLENSGEGGPLWGRIFGNNHNSVPELLAQSTDLSIRQETIDAVACYVLQGTTRYGKTTAWVAPAMNYSALKWSIEKQGADLFDDKPSPVQSWLAVFDSVTFQNIDGQFVPTSGIFTLAVTHSDASTTSSREQYTVSDIRLNPDFNAIDAFEINLPNGLRIFAQDAPGIRYKWKDGSVTPDVDGPTFDEIDKIVDQVKAQQ